VREAKLEVAKFCQSEKTTQPPDDAMEYLAGELVRLTVEGHSSRVRGGSLEPLKP
jgi:hypothetical protein